MMQKLKKSWKNYLSRSLTAVQCSGKCPLHYLPFDASIYLFLSIWSIFFNHPRRPGAVCQCPECPMMNAVNEAVTIIFSARFLPQSAVSLPCLLQGVRGFVSSSAPTYFVVTLSLCLVCAGLVLLGWARLILLLKRSSHWFECNNTSFNWMV